MPVVKHASEAGKERLGGDIDVDDHRYPDDPEKNPAPASRKAPRGPEQRLDLRQDIRRCRGQIDEHELSSDPERNHRVSVEPLDLIE